MSDPQTQALIDRLDAGGAWAKLSREFYATGTFTPVLGGSTTDGTISYSVQSGHYVRVGALIHAFVRIDVNTVSVAPTGNLRLGNLPFTSANVTDVYGYGMMNYENLNLSAGCIDVACRVTPNDTAAMFLESFDNAGGAALQGSAITNGTRIIGLIIYEAAG